MPDNNRKNSYFNTPSTVLNKANYERIQTGFEETSSELTSEEFNQLEMNALVCDIGISASFVVELKVVSFMLGQQRLFMSALYGGYNRSGEEN